MFVNVGSPIDVDAAVAVGADGKRCRCERSRRRPRDDRADRDGTTPGRPDFEDWSEAHLLTAGSDITLRSLLDDPAADVDFGLRDRLANTLADRPREQRAHICAAVARYRDDLDSVGYSDAELHSRLDAGRFVRSMVWQLLIGAFLLPFALAGAAINLIPFLIVKAVGALRVAPSMLSTIKPVAAFGAFGVTWGIVIWLCVRSFGWEGGAAAFVLLPVYLAAVIVVVERGTDVASRPSPPRRRIGPGAPGADRGASSSRGRIGVGSMSDWVLLLLVALPLLALWIRSIVEVAGRSDSSGSQRLVWLLILILIPILGLAAYVVARTPPKSRVSGGNSDSRRAESLVLLAERRQRGEVDEADYGEAVAAFRPG